MAEYIEYHPLKFWLDPASIAEIVAHIQTYLVNNPINSTTEIETIIHDYLIAHPEIIGGVRSINGETGEVVLTADNISGGENVTIKDVLDSLQDQIDDIVASIPSDYQQLIDDVSDLKSAIINSLALDMTAKKNAYVTKEIGTEASFKNSNATVSIDKIIRVFANQKYDISVTNSESPASTNPRDFVVVDDDNIIRGVFALATKASTTNKVTITSPVDGWLILCVDKNYTNVDIKGYAIPNDIFDLKKDTKDIQSAIDDINNGVYYDCDLDWSELLTTYPSGWRKGYFSGSIGSPYATNNNSNNYIRSAGSIRIGNGGGMTGDIAYLEFVPPSGYSIQVTEARNSDNVIVSQKGHRNSQDSPEDIDVHIVYKFNSECRYVVNVGYFADGDAEIKAADTDFTNTIKCKIYKYRSKKLPWTSKLQYFKVPINKKDLFAQSTDELLEENVDCVLGLPASYTNDGKPTKLIFMHHGQSGTVSADNETWYPESSVWANFVNEYLNAGYAVFDVNGSGAYNGDADTDANHQDYGCPNAIQAAFKAYSYIRENYNVEPHIFVHGSSMGAVLAYSFAKVHSNIVDAIGLFSPALLFLSATGQSDLSPDSLNAVAVNYGYSSVADMVSDGYKNLIQCSPFITFVDSDGAIVGKPYSYNWVDNYEADSLSIKCGDINMPIKIWCGSADTSVNPKNGDALTEALKNTGRSAYFRLIQGANHSAGIGANETVRNEAVLWFNRFK